MEDMLVEAGTAVVTSASIAMLLLEGLKWLVKFGQKKLGKAVTEFPMKFYYILLPVLSFTVEPLMALLGFTEYSLPVDWHGWALELGRVVVTALVTVLLYENSLAKLKQAKARRESLG